MSTADQMMVLEVVRTEGPITITETARRLGIDRRLAWSRMRSLERYGLVTETGAVAVGCTTATLWEAVA